MFPVLPLVFYAFFLENNILVITAYDICTCNAEFFIYFYMFCVVETQGVKTLGESSLLVIVSPTTYDPTHVIEK